SPLEQNSICSSTLSALSSCSTPSQLKRRPQPNSLATTQEVNSFAWAPSMQGCATSRTSTTLQRPTVPRLVAFARSGDCWTEPIQNKRFLVAKRLSLWF
uniref:Ovule protein n=1 Tax=Haemonchus contortus TaxID=6289 RepID=A0A7I4YRA2_HAECO